MQHLEKLSQIIEQVKPKLRFDKAPIVRGIDNNKLAFITAKRLITLDQPTKIQDFAAKLGRDILQPFSEEGELEYNEKRNQQLAGLGILRALLTNNIVYKRLEKECIGTAEDGTKIYKTIEKDGYVLTVKHWMLYVQDKEMVEELFYSLPVDINLKGVPTVNKPKKRLKFFDYEAGPLVTKVNKTYIKHFSKKVIPLVYKQINDLQSIAWEINQDVKTAIEANLGQDYFTYADKILDAEAKQGLERDRNMTLSIANEVGNKPFYFYWFMDKRGRFYPSSTYLSPQGGKLGKSLLYFSEKKMLGSEGLFWLKVHTANCAGLDKLSIEDRWKSTENALELIRAIGMDPVGSYPIWSRVSEPEPFLAACIELYKAYKLVNPEHFESGLPLGADATTSGLQIMAMISRDEYVGMHTNLTNTDEVGDIYRFVADGVEWGDHPFWAKYRNKARKLCKRPVMTKYYSAGVATIAKAIMSDWKSELKGLKQDHADWLATEINKVCNTRLKGPSQIMKLFIKAGTDKAEKGQLLYLQGMHNKFPFIQSYTFPETSRVDFKVGGERLTISYVSKESKWLDKRSISSGSAPNVIHFLDAQLVSSLLSKVDYTLSPTHDCFYTHAATFGNMFEDVREAFYELFGAQDILQHICDYLDVPNTIKYGQLDTTQVLDNEYCFS